MVGARGLELPIDFCPYFHAHYVDFLRFCKLPIKNQLWLN